MRRSSLLLAGILAAVLIMQPGAGHPLEAAAGMPEALPLPGSLDGFYPPNADRPVYQLGMLSLETSFSGIAVDLMEDDVTGARESFEEFRRKYRATAAMVPEWKEEYPEEKVMELGRALAAGDKGLALKALAAVGEACHRCHVAAMVPVQQKYHWGDIGELTVLDPLSATKVGYPQFKRSLSANLAGITNDLREGQAGNARKQYAQFRMRFESLEGSCKSCHGNESLRFVDRDVRAAVANLGEALQAGTVAAETVAALVGEIGRQSCAKCHRVHLPAAYAKRSLRGPLPAGQVP